ncbi:MAG: toll/interleukin-1 receptor domain-containing protein [Myxococcales bacterium]|nr:toll/interleukin-1 receptor domain-containing protein [Myxococcales bacterium]
MPSHDVFVSYAHVDNETLLEEQTGWISIFQRALQKRLGQLLGRQAAVWWDRKRLSGNHHFDETIATACEHATVMVSVVTPRYLKSDYCRHEVDHFAASRGLKVGDRSRLFMCVKTPVERGDLFPQMEGKLGYEFFQQEEAGGRFREYEIYDPALKPLFMATLEDLAQDVGRLVGQLGSDRSSSAPEIAPATSQPVVRTSKAPEPPTSEGADAAPRQSVLVATTAGDIKAVREGIVRELSARDHVALPSVAWSEEADAFETELSQAIDGVCLSVHMLGDKYGVTPEDGEASYPVLQLEQVKRMAAQRAETEPLARILWIAPEATGANGRQQRLLEELRGDPTLGPLDELLEGSEEELKDRILSKLRALAELRRQREERARQAVERDARLLAPGGLSQPVLAVKKVYVISADAEGDDVEEVERALGSHGFDVISSLELQEEETESEREALHQRWLGECDGCLIYHGQSKVSWVRAQIDDVRKALGHRREGPMGGHVVYVAPPVEGLKKRYRVHFPKLEGLREPVQDLEPFVALLRTPSDPEADSIAG